MQLSLIFICWVASQVSGQRVVNPIKGDQSIVQITDFYKGYGKIFNERSFLIPAEAKSVVTLTAKDVLLAEEILDSSFVDLTKSIESLTALRGEMYKEVYAEFYRQYVAYSDANDEIVVAVHLIKCCKGKIKKCFPDWKQALGSPLDEDPCTITFTYLINLNRKKVLSY